MDLHDALEEAEDLIEYYKQRLATAKEKGDESGRLRAEGAIQAMSKFADELDDGIKEE